MEKAISAFGLIMMMVFAWALSNNRRRMDWRLIGTGLAMQIALALIVLKTSPGQAFFVWANDFVTGVVDLSDEGAKFLFGDKFTDHFFAFKVLPTIIFVSSLSYLLFYWGVLQKVVAFMAWTMQRVMGASGSESLCSAANVFLGQTEAPLFVKPYLRTMTNSELMCMMTGGMANVAGGVLAAYVGFGISAGHLLAGSLMSAPACIVIAKIMYPETGVSPTKGQVSVKLEIPEQNAFDAACKGASEGLMLALNVGAMLIAFIALTALVNKILMVGGGYFGVQITFQEIVGRLFQPFAFLMGVPVEDTFKVGQLLGEKTVLNEFVAYIHLGDLVKAGAISERAATIATYALCGFANFSSIAIQIGGIGALEPSRRVDIARLGFLSMVGGTLSTFMTASIAGMLL